ncbi:MAG TPA: hypothetical protein VGI64_16950 [Streptosporangiaceae bacterium]|jgi:hypothetical protein
MYAQFAAKADLADDATLQAIVDAVHAIPYGRPPVRTPDGVIQSWRGTCSTKHALLMAILRERWPVLRPRLIHRVYRADKATVRRRYGPAVAAAVPENGLTDVHRYLAISLGAAEVTLDVTFPADARWDGRSSMRLACGDGQDFAAGNDPDADKAALEAQHCDPRLREPFIAALAATSAASRA